jgi:hypothetical protein
MKGVDAMRRVLAIGLVTAAVLAFPLEAQARPADPGQFTMFNPCTGEDVQITGTFHYRSDKHGDYSHTSDASGVGLTTGQQYRFVFRFVETSDAYFEVVRLIALGPASDLSYTDDVGDAIEPAPSCS